MGNKVSKRVSTGRERATKGEVIPVQFIRVAETTIRKYPMHMLQGKWSNAKEIEVSDRDPHGNELVRYHAWFTAPEGVPGPLAYRVERLVIDRAIEQQTVGGDPPTFVRLGTLPEICDALGLCRSGKNMKDIRDALYQLMGTAIAINVVGGDSLPRFYRFPGVTLTGKERSDGSRADAVYVELSALYRELIKRAKTRPLDYDYLRDLAPAAARLYEIISSRIFAALNLGSATPEARILYSHFIELSGLKRYRLQWEMTKQMKRLDEPHFASGYISGVSYRPRVDRDGEPDWMMAYTPGPKARREYDAAMRRGEVQPPAQVIEIAPVEGVADTPPTPKQSPKPTSRAPAPEPTQEPLDLPPDPPLTEAQAISQRLVAAGVWITKAQALVESNPDSARLWAEVFEAGCIPKAIRDVPAYLAGAILNNAPAPQEYKAHVGKKHLEAAQAEEKKRKAAEARRAGAEQHILRVTFDKWLDGLSYEDGQAFDQEILATIPANQLKLLSPTGISQYLNGQRFRHWLETRMSKSV
jgi:hypothetical protein